MASTLPGSAVPRLPELPDRSGDPAKASIRKAEAERWKTAVGQAIDRTRQLASLSLKEYAALIGRDERQIARWITGEERPQVDAIFAVETLRFPLIQALSELTQATVEVVVRLPKRRAL